MRSHAAKALRTLAAAGVVAALVVVPGVVTATPAAADTTSCQGVLSGGGDGALDKTVLSVTPGANAGDYTIVYSLQSERPAGVYRVRDCAFIDTGAAGYDGEPFVGTTDEKDVTFTSSNGGGSSASFTQDVTGVDPNDQLCDRAAVSGTAAGIGFTDKSNLLCFAPNNPPVVSESMLAVTLPLAAVAAVGTVLLVQRRRRTVAVDNA